jgi:hypothetical protein
MVAEIETIDPLRPAPARVTPVPRPPRRVPAQDGAGSIDLSDLALLAADAIRPHLLTYTLVALAVGFVAGRSLR